MLYLPMPVHLITDDKIKSSKNAFYITYLTISRNATLEHKSYITLRQIFDFYNQTPRSTKPKLFYDVLSSLSSMAEDKMISFNLDFNGISYDTYIPIKINRHKFYSQQYKMVFLHHLDYIQALPNTYKKDNLIKVYLYLVGSIFSRGTKFNNPTSAPDYIYKPEACWRSIGTISKTVSLASKTIIKCLDVLAAEDDNAPFRRYTHDNSRSMPFVYALNAGGYENELAGGYKKLCQYKYGSGA